MKLLTIILAIIALTLSSIPCSDEAIEVIDTVQTDNNSEHSDDNCTPFCSCICCGAVVSFKVLAFEEAKTNTIIVSHCFNHENLFTQGYITSIWYPPIAS